MRISFLNALWDAPTDIISVPHVNLDNSTNMKDMCPYDRGFLGRWACAERRSQKRADAIASEFDVQK